MQSQKPEAVLIRHLIQLSVEKCGNRYFMDYAQTLGIYSDADEKEIKQAYAKLVKQFRPDTHPIEFAEIREAYEIALQQLKWSKNYVWDESIEHENTSVDLSLAHNKTKSITEEDNRLENNVNPSNLDFTTFLNSLNELAQNSSESLAEELTTNFLSKLNQASLDEKFNIEIELLTWIYDTDKPLLLAFTQLDEVFGWTKTGAYAVRAFSEFEMQRLFFLRRLADIYIKAIEEKDINLATDKKNDWWFIQSISKINQRNEWYSITQHFGYEHLKSYFKPPENSKFQLFWSDIIVASMLGAIGCLAAKYNDISHAYLVFIGVFISTLATKIYLGSYVSFGFKCIQTILQKIDSRHAKLKNFLHNYKFKNSYVIVMVSILFFALVTFDSTQNKIFHWLIFSITGLLAVIALIGVFAYLTSALIVIFLALTVSIANVPYTIAYAIENTGFGLFRFFRNTMQKPYIWIKVISKAKEK